MTFCRWENTALATPSGVVHLTRLNMLKGPSNPRFYILVCVTVSVCVHVYVCVCVCVCAHVHWGYGFCLFAEFLKVSDIL